MKYNSIGYGISSTNNFINGDIQTLIINNHFHVWHGQKVQLKLEQQRIQESSKYSMKSGYVVRSQADKHLETFANKIYDFRLVWQNNHFTKNKKNHKIAFNEVLLLFLCLKLILFVTILLCLLFIFYLTRHLVKPFEHFYGFLNSLNIHDSISYSNKKIVILFSLQRNVLYSI